MKKVHGLVGCGTEKKVMGYSVGRVGEEALGASAHSALDEQPHARPEKTHAQADERDADAQMTTARCRMISVKNCASEGSGNNHEKEVAFAAVIGPNYQQSSIGELKLTETEEGSILGSDLV